ncbi:MAG: enoyl-CoA hydratase/isomerase family protein, partial [Candidatus Omnitrophica bacterium]|nr:enoyl-CoA hydratase/isomerase family protein [Candidatus Omnitrophota bacterium]
EIESITDVADAKQKAQAGQNLFNKIEDLKIPTIAVIDGVALGGGCELAMACLYRVATFNEKVKIGLPEVNLGFVPGFGGCYRLPRLVGLSQALKMILSGKPVGSGPALKMGLVDALFPQSTLEADLAVFIQKVLKESPRMKFQRMSPKGLAGFLDNSPIGNSLVFDQSKKGVMEATKGFYPAPLKAIEVLKETRTMSRDEALDYEAQSFAELAVTNISKNLVKIFFLSEKFKKYTPVEIQTVEPAKITKAGVIGAGIMGGGIAQLLSDRGVWVRMKDMNYEAIAKGLAAAYKVYQGALKKKRLKPYELSAKMAMISGTVDYSGFQDSDLVIEAVVENMDVKRKVFQELDGQVPPGAVICSNTSSLSVTQMAESVKDPSRVIGFHFFNPVHRMPLIEIITTKYSSPRSIATTLDFARRLGKTPILVKDAPGFLVNRILLGYINEAGRLFEEGMRIDDIDNLMVEFGMPMGPFTLSDEVGLDVGVKVLHILEAGLGPRYKPVESFIKIYEKKLFGKKSGKGFYVHGKKRELNTEVADMIDRPGGVFDKTEALNRMLLTMINEAAMCLQEKIIDGADVVDIGMVMGTGFPPFHGGLLRYADGQGIDNVVDILNELEEEYNDGRFKPCGYLLNLKSSGKKFYSQELP